MDADGLDALLGEALAAVERQARHLEHTRDGLPYPGSLDALDNPEVLERYEALTARFARLQDLLIHPFRAIARIEIEDERAERVPDLLALMEKRGIVRDASAWRAMREVRNRIAHDYTGDPTKLKVLLARVHEYAGVLLETVRDLRQYAAQYRR